MPASVVPAFSFVSLRIFRASLTAAQSTTFTFMGNACICAPDWDPIEDRTTAAI